MKKLLCCLFTMLLIISTIGLIACGGKKEQTATFKINGFNNYDEIVAFDYKNIFGVININDNKDYIKEGDASAEVIINKKVGAQTPTFVLKANNDVTTKNDITDVTEFHVDIYNKSDKDIYFTFRANTNTTSVVSFEMTVPLTKNGWNTITIPVNRDVTHFVGQNVVDYELAFVGIQDEELENPIYIYLDNFYAVTTPTPHKSEKIDQIQNVIDSIVSVNKSDKTALDNVMELYNALSSEEKPAVHNYNQLFDALNKFYTDGIINAREEDPSALFFFDKDFGSGHIKGSFGGISGYTYSTERKYENTEANISEEGSLKVSFSSVGEIWTKLLYEIGTYSADDYRVVVFYVYNESDQDKGLGVNWMGNDPLHPELDKDPVTIKANEWTRVELPAKLFETEPAEEIEIAGYENADHKGAHPTGNLYFSRFRSVEYTLDGDAKMVSDLIDDLPSPSHIKPSDKNKVESAISAYNNLTNEQKDMIIAKNYDKLLKVTNKVYEEIILEKRKERPELLFDFSSKEGLGHITNISNAYISFDDVNGGIKLDFYEKADVWSIIRYDIYDYDVSKLNLITFKVYNPTDSAKGIYINWRGVEFMDKGKLTYQPYTLLPKTETTIVAPASYLMATETFGDCEINICGYDPATMDVRKLDGSLIIKEITAQTISKSAKAVIDRIANLPEADKVTIDNKAEIEETYALYKALSETDKSVVKVNNYTKLKNVRIALMGIIRPNDVVFFDDEIILEQLGGKFEFVENKEIGSKTGNFTTVKGNATNDAGDWRAFFLRNPAIRKLSDYDEMEITFYYEPTSDIGGNAIFTYFWEGATTIKPDEWNTIIVRKSNGWEGFYKGTYPKYHINDLSDLEIDYNISGTLYFSSLKVRIYNLDEPTQSVVDMIKNLKPYEDITISDKQTVLDILTAYNNLTDKQKYNIYQTEYDKVQRYLNRVYELEYFEKGEGNGTVVNFGKDFGMYQVYSPNADYGYSTKVKNNGDGSIYIKGEPTKSGDNWADDWKDLIIRYPSISDINHYDRMVIEFYYEKNDNNFNNDYMFVSWTNPPIKLTAGWNHLVFRKGEGWGALSGYGTTDISSINFNINISGKVYFTEMRLFDDESVIADLSLTDKYFTGENNCLSYTVDQHETGKVGATRIDISGSSLSAKLNYKPFDTAYFKNVDFKIKSGANGVMKIGNQTFNIVSGDYQTISVPVSVINSNSTITFIMESVGYVYLSDITGTGTNDIFINNNDLAEINKVWSVNKESVGKIDYSEDFSVAGESGSMKVTFTGSDSENELFYDLKSMPSGKFMFYVYNHSDNDTKLSVNWQPEATFILTANSWTKIIVDNTCLFVDGFHNILISQPEKIFAGELYFSSFREIKDDKLMSSFVTDFSSDSGINQFKNKVVVDDNGTADVTSSSQVKFAGRNTMAVGNMSKAGTVHFFHKLNPSKLGTSVRFGMWVYNDTTDVIRVQPGWKEITVEIGKGFGYVELTKDSITNGWTGEFGAEIPFWNPNGTDGKGAKVDGTVYFSEIFALDDFFNSYEMVVDFTSEEKINANMDKVATTQATATSGEYMGIKMMKLDFNATGHMQVFHKVNPESLNGAKTLGFYVYNGSDDIIMIDVNWLELNVYVKAGKMEYVEMQTSQFIRTDTGEMLRYFLVNNANTGGQINGSIYFSSMYKVN